MQVTAEEVRRLVASGTLTGHTMMWAEGMESWQPLGARSHRSVNSFMCDARSVVLKRGWVGRPPERGEDVRGFGHGPNDPRVVADAAVRLGVACRMSCSS